MTGHLPDDELRLNRRLFLQHSAAAAATTAAFYSIALKTDALSRASAVEKVGGGRGDGMPYPYYEP